MQQQRIYLDFNATTPIAPEVAAVMRQTLTEPFGNPSSEHWAGQAARQAVEKARAQVAALETERIRQLRDFFWELLQSRFAERVVLNGHPTERLPNTLNVNFVGKAGSEILNRLEDVAASTGSACHSGSPLGNLFPTCSRKSQCNW